MMLFVSTWFERTERRLGLAEIQKYFPRYIDITGNIDKVQNLIAESRGNRTERRDLIYDDIEKSGYDEILSLYENMKTSEPRVQAQVKVERRQTRILVWGTIAGVVIALIALAIAVLGYLAPLSPALQSH